jgi:hypothetical protein
MNDVFVETLRNWQNFYFMTGGAAGGLMGLMFVALSLGTHLINDKTRANMRVFVAPSIFYFVSALLISCVMLVPNYSPVLLALTLFVGGMVGISQAVPTARRLITIAREYGDFDHADWAFQITLPVVVYLLLMVGGGCFAFGQWDVGFGAVWLSDIFLLLIAIANTWSLVIWIVDQRTE